MRTLKTAVVAVVLGAMFSPAIGLAKTEPATPPVPARQVVQTGVALAGAVASTATALATQSAQNGQSEAAQYADREQQSKDLQDFKGGAVYVYFGSGVVLALIIIILILL